ncbi:hypothetical protein GCM10027569_81960 [Flindersiella endophytica]
MVLQPQDVAQVVRLHLDTGLAHLVSGLDHRVLLPLDDDDVEVGQATFQLEGEGEAGDAAAKNGHVNVVR